MNTNDPSGNVQTYEYTYEYNEKGGKFGNACKGCFSRLLHYVLYMVIGIVVFYGINAVSKWYSENNNTQKTAEYSLNEIIENGETPPVGEYVSLEVQLAIGPYAEETQTRETDYHMTAVVKEKEYHLVLLEDGTCLTVATTNTDEQQALAQLCDAALAADDLYTLYDGDSILLQGELKEMTDPDLLRYYREMLDTVGLGRTYEGATLLVLDTEAGRGAGIILPIIAIVAVIIVITLISKRRKAKMEEEQCAQMLREAQQEENSMV